VDAGDSPQAGYRRSNDVQFDDLAREYVFGVAVFDNARSNTRIRCAAPPGVSAVTKIYVTLEWHVVAGVVLTGHGMADYVRGPQEASRR
jgi:hypothetical protein